MMIFDELERLLKDEGFKAYPYQDHLGNWTFGHGLTWISEQESKEIAKGRMLANFKDLSARLPWFAHSHPVVQGVLVNMSYQMGVDGVMKFRKTLDYLHEQDYGNAAVEMLDSKWAKQTPNRAERMSKRIEALAG